MLVSRGCVRPHGVELPVSCSGLPCLQGWTAGCEVLSPPPARAACDSCSDAHGSSSLGPEGRAGFLQQG
jgi:hypothetical protein